MTARYQFLPWVRQGAASGFTNPDPLQPVLALPGGKPLSVFPVNLRVNDATKVEVQLRLYSPGDIIGIDPRIIIRTDPPPLTSDFEPNFLACIEFDLPDFPWMFTPATAGKNGRLRPWLCLVVLELGEDVSLRQLPGQSLPIVTAPVSQLPNLAESWAWSHAQVVLAEETQTAEQALTSLPDQNLSRLVCPRRLQPNTRYLACLVPTFEAGRKAGLGLEVTPEDENRLRPAWDESQAQVQLPVYYHWEFGTEAAGDFEALVRRLEGRPVSADIGRRPVRVANQPFGLPDLGLLEMEGALISPTSLAPKTIGAAFQNRLRNLLNLSAKQPVVTPPIYGRWQAAQAAIPPPNQPPLWLAQLNVDPRLRAAAGLGVQIVQQQQEQLVASAWEQLGDAHKVVQLVRRLDFSQAMLQSVLHKRLERMTSVELVQLLGPGQARLRASPETLRFKLEQIGLPRSFSSASFRRTLRPLGPLTRRVAPVNVGPARLEKIGIQLIASVPPVEPSPLTKGLINLALLQVGVIPDPNSLQVRYLKAARDVKSYFERFFGQKLPTSQPPFPVTDDFKRELLASLDPRQPSRQRFVARLSSAQGVARSPGTEGETLLVGPSFPQPMYAALRDLSPEFLLPGVVNIPPDTVTLLETNPSFIEAYMVGLNHELTAELLWREFPGDQRQTYFRNFWDTRGALQKSAQLPPIHTWDPASSIGANFSADKGQLVLLIRGQLLLRYPDAFIYAVQAKSATQLGEQEKFPIFRGRIKPDITFLGFDLSEDEARGSDGQLGWFFVIQEQPTAPRFGLDVFREGELTTWDDLSWDDVKIAPSDHLKLGVPKPVVAKPNGLEWAFNAAHMAGILRQRPIRVAIHARRILPSPAEFPNFEEDRDEDV